MADITGNSIFARARTIATQQGGDANTSPVVDALGGLRAMLNETIRTLYRSKANDQKFTNDIQTKTSTTITTGVGIVPDEMMREFLDQANITDDDDSLVTFLNYSIDLNERFDQLGYLLIDGDSFNYYAPADTALAYTGNLYVTVPSFPEFPGTMSDPITFPSLAIIDDLCDLLALELRGSVKTTAV